MARGKEERATLDTIAGELGVSQASVPQARNNRPAVSAARPARVLIDGRRYYAQEARFGGIVVLPADRGRADHTHGTAPQGCSPVRPRRRPVPG